MSEEDKNEVLSNIESKNIGKNTRNSKKQSVSLLSIALEPEELRTVVEKLSSETDNEIRCQMVERIVQMIVEDEVDTESMPTLASCLSNILLEQIGTHIFPTGSPNDEALTDSISTPLFVMFRNHFQLCKEEDNRRKLLARVLADIQSLRPKLGYLLLYFLKVWGKEQEKREGELSNNLNGIKASVYENFCSQRDEKMDSCLLSDLRLCHDDNISMLCYLIPDIYMEFQNVALGNEHLLHLVVSTIDSTQLQDLVCQIMQGHLKMFKKDSFSSLLMASLNWDTFEQYCFWQLTFAHDFSIDYILPSLPKLQFRYHPEALTSILFMLKQEKPTQELLKQLLARQNVDGDIFVIAALRYWCQEYENKLGELSATLLSTCYPATSPNKRKRSNVKSNQTSGIPSGEQVLGHLDRLRQHCRSTSELQLYHLESMQKALQQAQSVSSDSIRKSYGDLFALAETNIENDLPVTLTTSSRKSSQVTASASLTKVSSRRIVSKEKTTYKRAPPRDRNTESSEQSSEDEKIRKPKQAKKRKKINPVGSDSD